MRHMKILITVMMMIMMMAATSPLPATETSPPLISPPCPAENTSVRSLFSSTKMSNFLQLTNSIHDGCQSWGNLKTEDVNIWCCSSWESSSVWALSSNSFTVFKDLNVFVVSVSCRGVSEPTKTHNFMQILICGFWFFFFFQTAAVNAPADHRRSPPSWARPPNNFLLSPPMWGTTRWSCFPFSALLLLVEWFPLKLKPLCL